MRYETMGHIGIYVSECGLGTRTMGGGAYGITNNDESIRTIHSARESSINFLNPAPVYTATRSRTVAREDAQSSSKCII